jgi:formate dehydrogenase major subunit
MLWGLQTWRCNGNIGRPGSGVNPLRGQNNVQGACDMGALPMFIPAISHPLPETKKKFEQHGVAAFPSKGD